MTAIASLGNVSRVVKLTLMRIMLRLILSVFFSSILLSGCTSTSELMKKSFDQDYKVLDRGKLDVIVKSQACALIVKEAISSAKRNAKFHLRSIIGNQNHRTKIKEVNRYNNGNKICVEMTAAALPPL